MSGMECIHRSCQEFSRRCKDPHYKEIVQNMLEKLRVYRCNMSLKLHLLHSHLDYIPGNLGAFSEEQGERFHQDLKELEKHCQRYWDVNIMADYCWSVKQEDTSQEHSRTACIHTFMGNRKHRCSVLHPNFLGNVNRLFKLQYFQMSCMYACFACLHSFWSTCAYFLSYQTKAQTTM